MAMWRGMLYRIERLRRSGYLRLPHDARRHRFEDLLQAEPLERAVAVTPEEDVAVLAPTGGTTSSPKAVMLTHRNLVANALQLRNWCGGDDGTESLLGVLPFFHAYGLTVSLLTSWAKGDTLHLHPRFETRAVLSLLGSAAAGDRAGRAGHARTPSTTSCATSHTTCRSSASSSPAPRPWSRACARSSRSTASAPSSRATA